MDVLLASSNRHKCDEYRRLFAGSSIRFQTPIEAGLAPLHVAEDGATFAANARLKARAYLEAYGRPCLADDSGICVDILAGAPGVRSARFGDASLDDAGRVEYLLRCLAGVEQNRRGAHYVCSIVLALPQGEPVVSEGMLYGRVGAAPSSGTTGFGYDPVFVVPPYGVTVAELTPEQKDAISHRGVAARRLLQAIVRRDQPAGTLKG